MSVHQCVQSMVTVGTGKPVAFKLIPQGGPTLLAKPYSLIAKRGLFATKHLWVTPHQEEERYAAGDWVLQAEGGDGLEEWVKKVWALAVCPNWKPCMHIRK